MKSKVRKVVNALKRFPQFQFTLKAARISCGYSVEEVAKKVRVRPSTIRKYEENAGELPLVLCMKILSLYGVSADLIHFGTEQECIEHNRAGVAALRKEEAERA